MSARARATCRPLRRPLPSPRYWPPLQASKFALSLNGQTDPRCGASIFNPLAPQGPILHWSAGQHPRGVVQGPLCQSDDPAVSGTSSDSGVCCPHALPPPACCCAAASAHSSLLHGCHPAPPCVQGCEPHGCAGGAACLRRARHAIAESGGADGTLRPVALGRRSRRAACRPEWRVGRAPRPRHAPSGSRVGSSGGGCGRGRRACGAPRTPATGPRLAAAA